MIALGDKLKVPIAFNVINTIRHYSTGDIDEKGVISATDDEISNAFSRILEAKRNGSHILNSEMYLKHFIGGKKSYRCHAKKVFTVKQHKQISGFCCHWSASVTQKNKRFSLLG